MSTPPAQSARLRFLVKKVAVHGTKKFEYRVYDQQRGSFPYRTVELGEVAQDHAKEDAAQDEADRLTRAHGYIQQGKATKKSRRSSMGEDDEDED